MPAYSCLCHQECRRCHRHGHRRHPCHPCRGLPGWHWVCRGSCPSCFGDRPRQCPGCCRTCLLRDLSQSRSVGEQNSFMMRFPTHTIRVLSSLQIPPFTVFCKPQYERCYWFKCSPLFSGMQAMSPQTHSYLFQRWMNRCTLFPQSCHIPLFH